MEELLDKLNQLLKPLDGLNSKIEVYYSGSTLTNRTVRNFDSPIVQQEVVSFSIECQALGIRGQHGIYQLVSRVRKAILGKRVVGFDPLVTAIVEVASQFQGETSPGYYSQTLIVQVTRPIINQQEIC